MNKLQIIEDFLKQENSKITKLCEYHIYARTGQRSNNRTREIKDDDIYFKAIDCHFCNRHPLPSELEYPGVYFDSTCEVPFKVKEEYLKNNNNYLTSLKETTNLKQIKQ